MSVARPARNFRPLLFAHGLSLHGPGVPKTVRPEATGSRVVSVVSDIATLRPRTAQRCPAPAVEGVYCPAVGLTWSVTQPEQTRSRWI